MTTSYHLRLCSLCVSLCHLRSFPLSQLPIFAPLPWVLSAVEITLATGAYSNKQQATHTCQPAAVVFDLVLLLVLLVLPTRLLPVDKPGTPPNKKRTCTGTRTGTRFLSAQLCRVYPRRPSLFGQPCRSPFLAWLGRSLVLVLVLVLLGLGWSWSRLGVSCVSRQEHGQ